MQPSSQNIPRGGIYPFQKINRKFDFRSACNKIPKTTAFTCILTLILGISYIKSHFFCIWVEFTFSKWNLILQSGIYFFNSPKCISGFQGIQDTQILLFRLLYKLIILTQTLPFGSSYALKIPIYHFH